MTKCSVPPEPCEACGCPVYWLTKTQGHCANCTPEKPLGKWYRGLVVQDEGGANVWANFDLELQHQRERSVA